MRVRFHTSNRELIDRAAGCVLPVPYQFYYAGSHEYTVRNPITRSRDIPADIVAQILSNFNNEMPDEFVRISIHTGIKD